MLEKLCTSRLCRAHLTLQREHAIALMNYPLSNLPAFKGSTGNGIDPVHKQSHPPSPQYYLPSRRRIVCNAHAFVNTKCVRLIEYRDGQSEIFTSRMLLSSRFTYAVLVIAVIMLINRHGVRYERFY